MVTSSICLSVKGRHLPSGQHQNADRYALAQQGHGQRGTHVGEARSAGQLELGIGLDVCDLNDPAFEHRPARDRAAVRLDGMSLHVVLLLGGKPEAGDVLIGAVPRQPDAHPVGAAEPRRRLDQRIEHRPQVEGRAADDLEHVRGRGLLLQRFAEIVGALAQFVEQPRVLDGDDGLRGEILTSSICLSVNGRTSWR